MGALFSIFHDISSGDCQNCARQIDECDDADHSSTARDFSSDAEENDDRIQIAELIKNLETWDLRQSIDETIDELSKFDLEDSKSTNPCQLKAPQRTESIESLDVLSPNHLFNRAVEFYLSQDYQKCMDVLNKILDEYNPKNHNCLLLRGRCYLELEKVPEAKADFNKLISIGKRIQGLYGLGCYHVLEKNYITANEQFEQITRLNRSFSLEDDEIIARAYLSMACITQVKKKTFENWKERSNDQLDMAKRMNPKYENYIEKLRKHF